MRYSLLQAIQWMGDGKHSGKLTIEEYAEAKQLYAKVSHRELAKMLGKKPDPKKSPTRADVARFNQLLLACVKP